MIPMNLRYGVTCFLAWLFVSGVATATVADGDRAVDRGDYVAAIDEYQAAYDLRNSNIKALYRLAMAKTYLAETLSGDAAELLYEEAAAHAQAAIEAAPDEPEAYFERARALGRLAQFRGIVSSLEIASEVKFNLEKTLELDPEHGGAYYVLALWNLNVPWVAGGRSTQARPLLEKAIAAEPDMIIFYVSYAEILLDSGDLPAAKQQLQKVLTFPVETFREKDALDKASELYDECCSN